MRQETPLSPAIRLGATNLLIISTESSGDNSKQQSGMEYPNISEIGGYILDGSAAEVLKLNIVSFTEICLQPASEYFQSYFVQTVANVQGKGYTFPRPEQLQKK